MAEKVNDSVDIRGAKAGMPPKDPGEMARAEKADLQRNISDRNGGE